MPLAPYLHPNHAIIYSSGHSNGQHPMNYILSEETYHHLLDLARTHKIDQIVAVLQTLPIQAQPADPKAKMSLEGADLYNEIMQLREDIAQDMQGKGPFDVEAWIRDDRER